MVFVAFSITPISLFTFILLTLPAFSFPSQDRPHLRRHIDLYAPRPTSTPRILHHSDSNLESLDRLAMRGKNLNGIGRGESVVRSTDSSSLDWRRETRSVRQRREFEPFLPFIEDKWEVIHRRQDAVVVGQSETTGSVDTAATPSDTSSTAISSTIGSSSSIVSASSSSTSLSLDVTSTSGTPTATTFPAATPTPTQDPTNAGEQPIPGGLATMEVQQFITEQQTSVGVIRTECIALVSNLEDKWCRTLLDGLPLDQGAPIGTPVAASPSPPSTSTSASVSGTSNSATISVYSISSSSSLDGTVTVAATETTASSTGSGLITSTLTVEVSASTILAGSGSTSANSGTSASSIITGTPTSATSTSSSAPNSSDPVTSNPVVVNDATSTSSAPPAASASANPSNSESNSDSDSNDNSDDEESDSNSDSEDVATSASSIVPSSIISAPSQTISSSSSPLPLPSSEGPVVVNSSPTPAPVNVAQAQQGNVQESFPGQSISVLPIGLGVFGGLLAIALGVVGYMLWQRKRYRGQFKKRKAEEEGEKGTGMASKGS